MRDFITAGMKRLGIEIKEGAVETAIEVSCGSPLACSQLMLETLSSLGRTKVRREITQNQVRTAADSWAHHLALSTYWRNIIRDQSHNSNIVLKALIYVGPDGAISALAQHVPKAINVTDYLRRLCSGSETAGYPDLIMQGEKYSFARPFLYEQLKLAMG